MRTYLLRIWELTSYIGLDDKSKTPENRNKIIANRLNSILFILLIFVNVATTIIREMNGAEYTIRTKNLLILLIICTLNFIFSRLNFHKIVIASLIFFPSLILVFLPLFLGSAEVSDFIFDPLIIFASAIIPTLILESKFSNKLYTISLVYFFIQLTALDNIILYFSDTNFVVLLNTPSFQLYYKLVLITIFLFITFTLHYLRNQNYKYELELSANNAELKLTLQELRTKEESLIYSEKMASFGILTAGIAHEINNPLNFIQNGVFVIENYINENLPEHKPVLDKLFDATSTGIERIADIVKSLNKYSSGDNLLSTECNIHDVIDECLTLLYSQYKNRINFRKNYIDSSPVLIASESKIHQIFINVLLNAVQSIRETGSISIETSLKKSEIKIDITDTGHGISPEKIKNIYDPFFTTKDPGKGTGLGLSITQKLIHELNGTIQCTSVVNEGTTFIITLPLKS